MPTLPTRSNTIYTPQMIIGGGADLVEKRTDPESVEGAIGRYQATKPEVNSASDPAAANRCVIAAEANPPLEAPLAGATRALSSLSQVSISNTARMTVAFWNIPTSSPDGP